MSVELKVKLKSLAEEARIIRKEELNYKEKRDFQKVNSLHLHRVMHIRPIARATHIAYGLLRGMDYHRIEQTTKSFPDWNKVRHMLKKYSKPDETELVLKNLEFIINEQWKISR